MPSLQLRPRLRASVVACLLCLGAGASQALNITTQRYDQNRTAANLQETVLNKANVQGTSFGKQGAYAVDGIVFAHPLYLQGVQINGATYNVLFVATMHNVVYAFNADKPGSAPLWKRDLRTASSTYVTSQWPGQIGGEMGIMSTPVIDAASGEMFFTAYAKEGTRSVYRLYAVNVSTGADTKPPSVIEPSQGGRQLEHPRNYQRAGLAMAGKQLWIAFGGNSLDTRPYTGWVLSYDKTTLQQTGQFRTSTYDGSTIWQGGGAPSVDADGNVYLITANGWGPGASSYDGVSNFSQSLLKMGPTASTLIDHFSPAKQPVFDALDQDFSTNTPVLIPGTDLVTAGSKVSDIYVARTGNLGKQTPDNRHLVQTWRVGTAVVGDGVFNEGSRVVGTVYWNRSAAPPLYYVWPGRDQLRMYSFDGQKFSANAVVTGTVTGAGEPGISMSLSANGSASGTGILWASRTTVGASAMNLPSVLEAYDAENPAIKLWSSAAYATRDGVGSAAKFVIPTVANGRVYMPTQNGTVLVYGLLPDLSLSLGNASVQGKAGDTVTTPITLSPLNGFSGQVQLTASGMPKGVNAVFSPSTLSSGGSSTLNLSASGSVAVGTYPITVTATSSTLVRTATVTLKVTAASSGDFTMGLGNGSLTVYPGATGTVAVNVGAVGSFANSVALSASGLPTGVTASFSPASVAGAGSAAMTLTVAPTVTAGSQAAITVKGSSGSTSHSTVMALNIGAQTTVTAPTYTAPTAPSALTATAAAPNSTGAGVTLRWTDNANNESGFVIQRSTAADFSTELTSITASANATMLVDSGPAPSTIYHYRIRASNNGTDSGYSNTAMVLTAGQLLDGELNDLRTPIKVMALGDSVTHGAVARNYMAPLWTKLRDNGCAADMVGPYRWADYNADTDHAAFDGLRADTAATAYIDTWTKAALPDAVLLHLGSYDAMAGVAPATTVAALGKLIDTVRTTRPNAVFYVAKLFPTSVVAYNTNIAALNALLPGLVSSKTRAGSAVVLVDQNALVTNTTTDLYDGIRPTTATAAKMASKWYDAMVANGQCSPTAAMSNLSNGKPVTVTGSTLTYAAGLLVNGKATAADEWVGMTTSKTPQTIEVDLGSSHKLGLFRLSQYTGNSVVNIYNALDFRIAVRNSTSEAWTDVVAVAGNTVGHTLHPVAPVNGRYVRLTLTRPNNFQYNYNYSTLREFEVYGW